MRGWVYRARGKPVDVLKLENDLPQQSAALLGPHEVLIKVKYVALFQGSAAMMSFMPHFNRNAWVAENNYSGTIVGIGAQVEHVAVDDDVFGGFAADVLRRYGGVLAEYVILPDHVVVRKPTNVALQDLAGMGAGGVTAMQFAEVTGLKKGDRVLITGASGGTGTLVVQAARAAVGDEGLVVGTCSAANEQLVKELGAHEVSPKDEWLPFVPMETLVMVEACNNRSSTTRNTNFSTSTSRKNTVPNRSTQSSTWLVKTTLSWRIRPHI